MLCILCHEEADMRLLFHASHLFIHIFFKMIHVTDTDAVTVQLVMLFILSIELEQKTHLGQSGAISNMPHLNFIFIQLSRHPSQISNNDMVKIESYVALLYDQKSALSYWHEAKSFLF